MKYIGSNKIFYHPERLQSWIDDGQVRPVTAEIHLSNRCNNACNYCGQKQNHNNTDMSIDNIKLLRKFIDSVGVKACYFSGGGESTLNPDLFTAIDELKGVELGMISNGLIMPDELIKKYVQEFTWVRISLDCADEQTYYKIRGVHGFEKVKANIKNLLTAKKESKGNTTIGIQVVINEFNDLQIPWIINQLLVLFPDIDYISIRPIEMLIKETVYSNSQISRFKEQFKLLKYSKKIIISEKWQDIFDNNHKHGFSTCHASKFLLTVTADADIYQCCHVTHLDDYRITHLSNYEDFFYQRHLMLGVVNNEGFNPGICPLGCRGSGINKSIETMIWEKHRNFL